ncbi:hypothetical protein TNCV_164421 [Trichonephila clavipes]|nr:hypothetical protein TNCV_164421 [Trichonephila clavipes]
MSKTGKQLKCNEPSNPKATAYDGGSLAVLGSNSWPAHHESIIFTTRLPQPPELHQNNENYVICDGIPPSKLPHYATADLTRVSLLNGSL